MKQLLELNQKYRANLAAIGQLTLSQWQQLASRLGVAVNDREHGAKKLAIRQMEITK